MPILDTQLDPQSQAYAENRQAMLAGIEQIRQLRRIKQAGS